METLLLEGIRNLSDDTIRSLTNLQTKEDIDILRTAILRRTKKWIDTQVLEVDAPWEHAWNLFRACFEIHRTVNVSEGNDHNKARFSLGRVVSTPGALKALEKAGQDPMEFLQRHQSGDWGELRQEDKRENAFSLKNGYRLLSAYSTKMGGKIFVITEADRSATLLLAREY